MSAWCNRNRLLTSQGVKRDVILSEGIPTPPAGFFDEHRLPLPLTSNNSTDVCLASQPEHQYRSAQRSHLAVHGPGDSLPPGYPMLEDAARQRVQTTASRQPQYRDFQRSVAASDALLRSPGEMHSHVTAARSASPAGAKPYSHQQSSDNGEQQRLQLQWQQRKGDGSEEHLGGVIGGFPNAESQKRRSGQQEGINPARRPPSSTAPDCNSEGVEATAAGQELLPDVGRGPKRSKSFPTTELLDLAPSYVPDTNEDAQLQPHVVQTPGDHVTTARAQGLHMAAGRGTDMRQGGSHKPVHRPGYPSPSLIHADSRALQTSDPRHAHLDNVDHHETYSSLHYHSNSLPANCNTLASRSSSTTMHLTAPSQHGTAQATALDYSRQPLGGQWDAHRDSMRQPAVQHLQGQGVDVSPSLHMLQGSPSCHTDSRVGQDGFEKLQGSYQEEAPPLHPVPGDLYEPHYSSARGGRLTQEQAHWAATVPLAPRRREPSALYSHSRGEWANGYTYHVRPDVRGRSRYPQVRFVEHSTQPPPVHQPPTLDEEDGSGVCPPPQPPGC